MNPTDHDLNLWAANFMGWHQVPVSGPNPKAGEFIADGESVWRGPYKDWGSSPQHWSPVTVPEQAVLLMAEAARRGVCIDPVLTYFGCVTGETRVNAPADATADDLVGIWCRLVCMSLYDRAHETRDSHA